MKMTIGKKLTFSFCGMLAMVLGLAYSSLSSIGTLNDELDKAINKTARKLDLAGQIGADGDAMRVAQRGMILYGLLKDQAMVDKSKALFEASAHKSEKDIADIKPLLTSDTGRQACDTILSQLGAWRPVYQELAQLSAAGRFTDIGKPLERAAAINDELQKTVDTLQQQQRDFLTASGAEAATLASRSRWLAIVLIGVCLAVGGLVVWLVRQISSTLHRVAVEMADGAEQVAAAASQVSASSQSLAQGSSEQAASIEQTSASSEQINSMARKNAENSKVAAEHMVETAQRVSEANRNLEHMVVSMNEINTSSDKISKIIKVIDEIAFQTNILALNAAVEAARAGEAGMGFAVVADEVRNLAQRCAQAAKDTSALIEESIAKSNDGKNKLDQVSSAVRSITEVAEKVKTLVDEVHLGSQEQARGIEQVSKAITQMEKVTQTTAANAEESASASEELSAQSDTLNSIVGRLNDMVGGAEESGGSRHRNSHRNGSNEKAQAAQKPKATFTVPATLAHAVKPAAHGAVNSQLAERSAATTGKDAFPLEEEFKEF